MSVAPRGGEIESVRLKKGGCVTVCFRIWLGAALAVLFWVSNPIDAAAQKIALISAESPVEAADVRAKLISAGLTDVTIIDVANRTVPPPPTPTLADLLQYDAILTWSDYSYTAPSALGDVLADYVDAGRGVVQAMFSFNPSVPLRLDGRWRSGAYEPFTFSLTQRVRNLTIVKTQPLHPILNGVATFDGGTSSYHGIVTTQGCADVVARWSNGQPLVATRLGPSGGRVVGLNFFPPSSDASSSYWISSTDGEILMANALRFAAQPVPPADGPIVALVAAEEPAWMEDVRCKLQNLQLFTRVDGIDARSVTPTLPTLLQYDSVLTWSDTPYASSSQLGDVLADYVDQDRGVVQSGVSLSTGLNSRLDGRWLIGGYRPFTEGSVVAAPGQTLVPDAVGHVILSGIATFDGGASSYHASPVALDAATVMVASWIDGQPLAVVGSGPTGGRVVGLNLFPPSSDSRSDLWNRNSDGARLMANALLFAANHRPTADAGLDQSVEVSSAAGAAFSLTGTAADPDGDVLAFSWSGAVTASGAAIVLDVPPPSAPNKTQTHSMTLTVSDGKGGEMTDSVDLTVTDTTAPTLHNVPAGMITADATSAAGAIVDYGVVTSTDAVDGDRPVVCLPSGVFPIGDTTVTCSSSDSRENGTSATFTIRVTDVSRPGAMQGHGFMQHGDARHEFAFSVSENTSGEEQGEFRLTVKTGNGRRGSSGDGDFVATSVDSVTFNGAAVLFRGEGRWNGQAGFRYEVQAADNGNPGRNHDAVRIMLTAPTGSVATAEGSLGGGNVILMRVRE